MGYGAAAVERAMTYHHVILCALARSLTWLQAADILGIDPRILRRWRARYERDPVLGLLDRRHRRPSHRTAPRAEVQRILHLYRERYQGFNVRQFHQPHPAGPPRQRAARGAGHHRRRGQCLSARPIHRRLQRHLHSAPTDPVSAFVPLGVELEQILCEKDKRGVAQDNTVSFGGVRLQLAKQPGRPTCVGLRVIVRRHLDSSYTIWRGPRGLGHYAPDARVLPLRLDRAPSGRLRVADAHLPPLPLRAAHPSSPRRRPGPRLPVGPGV